MNRLITIDGLDGSGKATQTSMLFDELQRRGVKSRLVSFPDYASPSSAPVKMYLDGAFGKKPGDVNAYAASSFFAVDRYASYVRRWRSDYKNGTLIIADRYTTSNMIYQLAKLPKGEWDGFISWLCDFEYKKLGLPEPGLTLYLDVDPGISQGLLNKRYNGDNNKKDIHESDVAYLCACRESASYAAQRLGWQSIDCVSSGKMRDAAAIHAEIIKIILGECK